MSDNERQHKDSKSSKLLRVVAAAAQVYWDNRRTVEEKEKALGIADAALAIGARRLWRNIARVFKREL